LVTRVMRSPRKKEKRQNGKTFLLICLRAADYVECTERRFP